MKLRDGLVVYREEETGTKRFRQIKRVFAPAALDGCVVGDWQRLGFRVEG